MITPILVVVPPTSKHTPLDALKYMREPMTPPSPRIIMRGTSTPAFLTLSSVGLAVFSIFVRMLALMAAVLVRLVRP